MDWDDVDLASLADPWDSRVDATTAEALNAAKIRVQRDHQCQEYILRCDDLPGLHARVPRADAVGKDCVEVFRRALMDLS